MLILPLHRPLNRRTFPWLTALLILANLLVFTLLQSGDGAAAAAAQRHYLQSGLAAIEAPLFRRHLQEHPEPELQAWLQQQPADQQSEQLAVLQQQDRLFRRRLAQGELFADQAAQARWHDLVAGYERLRQQIFTERHALDAEQPRLGALFGSMFLHGSVEHLLGNMLFLLALGLLVEGALSAPLFLALYMLGGTGAGLAWLAANATGSVVGASGAIAALMGAFCVLWGRRRVRFFYWFFVVFDYVRGPALALLPAWLGWELLQWWISDGAQVAYEAHAGGIAAGALLALGVKRLGWQREAFFDDATASAPVADHEAALRAALELLGRLQLAEAEQALQALEAQLPGRFEVIQGRYRCAMLARQVEQAQAQALRLLALQRVSAPQVREQWAVWQAQRAAGQDLPAPLSLALAQRLLGGDGSEAILALAQASPALAPQAQDWLALALRLHERGARAQALQLATLIAERAPGSVAAGKAEFLRGEWGRD